MKTSLRWLHLSDMHFGGSLFFDDRELAECVLDVAQGKAGDGWKPDILVVSGDIADKALEDEYREAGRFLEQLLQTFDLRRDRVMMCPGNHDIDRNTNPYLFAGCKARIDKPQDVKEFLKSDELPSLLARMSAYRKFREGFLLPTSEFTQDSCEINSLSRIVINGLELTFWEVNSAWLGYGGATDRGRLVVGGVLFDRFVKPVPAGPGCLSFGLIHHPFDWLAPFESDHIEAICCNNFDFVLRGHTHKPSLKTATIGQESAVFLTAGALVPKHARDYFFSFGSYDIADAKLVVEYHAYIADQRKWYVSRDELDLELPSRETLVASDVYNDMLETQLNFLAPAHMCTVICGMKNELGFSLNGVVGFYSPPLLGEATASEAKGALSLCRFQRVISFYGQNAFTEVIEQHGDFLQLYDSFLRRAVQTSPEFSESLTFREKEAKRIIGESSANIRGRSFAEIGLRRAIANNDLASVRRYITMLEDDLGSYLQVGIQKESYQNPSLYSTQLAKRLYQVGFSLLRLKNKAILRAFSHSTPYALFREKNSRFAIRSTIRRAVAIYRHICALPGTQTNGAYTESISISPEPKQTCHINHAILIATHGASGCGACPYSRMSSTYNVPVAPLPSIPITSFVTLCRSTPSDARSIFH